MSDIADKEIGVGSEHSVGYASGDQASGRRRKRRIWRVARWSLGALLGLVIVIVAGSYAYVNHVASSIPRIRVGYLVPATGASQTFLVTSDQFGPTEDDKTTPRPGESNAIMLLHFDANGKGGGVATIPGDTVVDVPGVGTEPLWDALKSGGPSLLVRTVGQLTGVPINHYARVDFSHIARLVDTIGGVDVTLPDTTRSFGHTFHAGVNHLTGVNAIYYARDPSLSDAHRLLRQEVLIRAILTRIAHDHLVTNPVTAVRVLNAITSALTVDSSLTNSGIESLTRKFGPLASNAATFVTAPTKTVKGKLVLNTPIADQLWTAIKHDSIARFAATYPSAVTPSVAP